jgi:hypothetical protein
VLPRKHVLAQSSFGIHDLDPRSAYLLIAYRATSRACTHVRGVIRVMLFMISLSDPL